MTRLSKRSRRCTGGCRSGCLVVCGVGETCCFRVKSDSLKAAGLFDARVERALGVCLRGDRRSDLYSLLFLFFPLFSGSSRYAASSIHNRCGGPNSSNVPDDGAAGSSDSPVRSIASTSTSTVRLVLLGVVAGPLVLRGGGGKSHWLSFP